MLRLRGTSKITPHKFDSLPQLLKAMFEIFDDHDFPFSYLNLIWPALIWPALARAALMQQA